MIIERKKFPPSPRKHFFFKLRYMKKKRDNEIRDIYKLLSNTKKMFIKITKQ